MKTLETQLRQVRASGRKALVPYLMAGLDDEWLDCLRAAVHAGADAIEIGLPFSDPMIDGVVVQEAANRALARGTTIDSVVAELAGADLGVPLVAMTYANVLAHGGYARSAGLLASAGVTGSIVPDLPLEEVGPWHEAASARDVATVLLVAPSTPPERAGRIARASEGFCYASARMAVTGAAAGTGHAESVVASIRAASDIPTYVGIGISTPEQARESAELADGVIVGSALVRRVLDGEGPGGVERFLAMFRAALH